MKEEKNSIGIIKEMYKKYWFTDLVKWTHSGCYAFLDETKEDTAWTKCDEKGFINWDDLKSNMIGNLKSQLESFTQHKKTISADIKKLEEIR